MYKVLKCTDDQCGRVGLVEEVIAENLSAGAASEKVMQLMDGACHIWFTKQELPHLTDEVEAAYKINELIDFENSDEYKLTGF